MGKWICVTDYVNTVPKLPGNYAIYILNLETKTKRLVYIGTANNLEVRLKKHEVKKALNALINYPETIYIKCKVVLDTTERLKSESILINRLKPRANAV